jgi:hypothetical protein
MAKKRSPRATPATRPAAPPPAAGRLGTVTADRAGRLYKMLQLLATGPQTREALTRQLGLDIRGFYRDLDLLRSSGIAVTLQERRYILQGAVDKAVARLPFPDPRLTLGEAQQLTKGRTAAHRKLKEQIGQILR